VSGQSSTAPCSGHCYGTNLTGLLCWAGDGSVEMGRAGEEHGWAGKCLVNTSVELVLLEHAG